MIAGEATVAVLLAQALGTGQERKALEELCRTPEGRDQLADALRRTAADSATFHATFQVSRRTLCITSRDAYAGLVRLELPQGQDWLKGFLGLLAFTLALLEAGDSTAGDGDQEGAPTAGHGDRDACPVESIGPNLFGDADVVTVFRQLYQPSGTDDAEHGTNVSLARYQWDELDGATLRFHRRGTTSFILRVETESIGDKHILALKCLLYPYTSLLPVTQDTVRYAHDFGRQERPSSFVRVRSSCDKWILMDFVDGLTLEEFMTSAAANGGTQRGAGQDALRLETTRLVGTKLLRALEELRTSTPRGNSGERRPAATRHLDLTPNNIIVVSDCPGGGRLREEDRLVLVDMGRNHLYTKAVGRLEGAEAIYVAPEVKLGRNGAETSDLYSFGMILIRVATGLRPTNVVVPDVLFEQAPPLARFLEDLIDDRPDRRLLLQWVPPSDLGASEVSKEPGPRPLPWAAGGAKYQDMASALDAGIRVLESAQRLSPRDDRPLHSIIDLYLSRHPRRHWKLWREGRRHADSFRSYSGWLLAWSVASAVNWYVITTVVFIWTLRNWQVNKFPLVVDVWGRIAGVKDTIPLVDSLRVDGYTFGSAESFQALLLALTFGLVATKYYQSIYASLTCRAIPGFRARLSEGLMRFNSVWVGGPVMVAVLVDPKLWPWCAATGYVGVAANDYFARSVAARSLRTDAFSTVPANLRQTLKTHGEWWWIMALYATILFALAFLLSTGRVSDWWVYAALIGLVNVGKLYPSNCTRLAPPVRGALARALVVGERLESLRRSGLEFTPDSDGKARVDGAWSRSSRPDALSTAGHPRGPGNRPAEPG